jgi:hypothetical protein
MLNACEKEKNKIISVTLNDGTQIEYYVGDEFDFSQVIVEIKFIIDKQETTFFMYNLDTDAKKDGLILTMSGFDSSEVSDSLQIIIKIEGGDNFIGTAELAYNVIIKPVVVSRQFVFENDIDKKEYQINESFNYNEVKLLKTYSDGTETFVNIDSSHVTGFDTSKMSGLKYLQISCENETLKIPYSVSPGVGYKLYEDSKSGAGVSFYYPNTFEASIYEADNAATDDFPFDQYCFVTQSEDVFAHFTYFVDEVSYADFNEYFFIQYVNSLNSSSDIEITSFEKKKINGFDGAIVYYELSETVGSGNFVWVFHESSAIIFSFAFPVGNDWVSIYNAIMNTIAFV